MLLNIGLELVLRSNVSDLDFGQHVSAARSHGCLQHHDNFLRLARSEINKNRSLQSAIGRIFNGPAIKLELRVFSQLVVILGCLEWKILGSERSKELASSLFKSFIIIADQDRKCLLRSRFIGEDELVAQGLPRNKLAEGDNFLINLE